MRKYTWQPYIGATKDLKIRGPFPLLSLLALAEVKVSAEEFDDLASLDVGEQYCIPEKPVYPNDPTLQQLGDFTRVE